MEHEEREHPERKSILRKEDFSGKKTEKTDRKGAVNFDEDNIKKTLHPEDKDYGFMKIPECNTPYERERPSDMAPIDPEELAKRLAGMEDTEEELKKAEERKKAFEAKKKAHYHKEFKKSPPDPSENHP